ncbi:MAG: CPXCG motif-containing cysteine-rich protein [Ignavibacteria bacterium]
MEYQFNCPYCWQEITFLLDISEFKQAYIEDCEVCCNPISIRFELEDGEIKLFEASKTE